MNGAKSHRKSEKIAKFFRLASPSSPASQSASQPASQPASQFSPASSPARSPALVGLHSLAGSFAAFLPVKQPLSPGTRMNGAKNLFAFCSNLMKSPILPDFGCLKI